MGRVVVHIGTHKTGTTSIQKNLAAHRAVLLQQGVLYPDYTMLGLGQHYAHLGMANALAGQHQKFTVQDAETFFAKSRDLSNSTGVTLFSAEPFYRQILSKTAPQNMRTPEEYWTARNNYIARFRNIIGPAEIVLVVRRQDDFAESMYQEQIKVTKFSKNFQTYLKNFWFHFNYAEQADAWAKYFPEVKIIPFQKIKGQNITQKFLALAGISATNIRDGQMQNVGMPQDGVILKRAANSLRLPQNSLQLLLECILSEKFRDALPCVKRSFFASHAHRDEFYQQHASGNARLAERAGLTVDELFGPARANNLIFGDAVTQESLEAMMRILQPILSDEHLEQLRKAATVIRTKRKLKLIKGDDGKASPS